MAIAGGYRLYAEVIDDEGFGSEEAGGRPQATLIGDWPTSKSNHGALSGLGRSWLEAIRWLWRFE
jgi:hypothetical protein